MISKGKVFLGVTLFITAIGIVVSISMFSKPHLDISNVDAQIVIDSNDLFKDYLTNETEANTKYLEQVIQVTGTIEDINIVKDKSIIALTSEDTFGSVLCHLDADKDHKIAQLQKGQSIQIKGVCTGFLMDVILVKSVIIN